MSGFGPPPGTPADTSSATGPRRPPSYLPPGGLRGGAAGRSSSLLPLLTTAHKPGIIPLRPLGLGDLLDGAAKHVRRNPGPVLGMTLLVVTISVIPSVLVAGLVSAGTWYSTLDLGSVVNPGEATAGLLVLGVAYAALVLCGMLALPVSEAVLGRRMSIGEMWAGVRPRVWRLLVLDLLVLAVVLVPTVVVVLLLTLLAQAPGAVVVAGGLAGLAVVVAWTALVVWRTALAGPAIVLERRGIRAGLRRGWVLSGRGFWRVAGSTALVVGIATVIFSVIGLVLGLVSLVVAGLSVSSDDAFALVVLVGSNVATLLSATLVVPFVAGAIALVYVDARMRREGFDVVLQRAAASSAPAGVRRR